MNNSQQVTSSNEDSGPVSCGCAEHKGKELINQTYNLSVERLLELMFTETEINRKFWTFRKLDNVIITDWINNHKRLDYSNNLGAFGVALVTEELQMLRHDYNECVVIESESFTRNVMYCEYFTVINRFCITKQTADSSHVYINFYLKYRKQPNFISKVFIEKNTEKALKDCFIYLAHILKDEKEEKKQINTSPSPPQINQESLGLSQTSQQSLSTHLTDKSSISAENDDLELPSRPTIITRPRRFSRTSRADNSFIREEIEPSQPGVQKTSPPPPQPVNHQDTVVFMSWRVSQSSFIKCLLFIIFLILFFNARIYMKLDRAERLVVSKLTYSEQMRGKTSSNCGTPSAAGGGGGDSLADHDAYIKREILQVRQLLTETFETLKQIENTLGKWDSRIENNGKKSINDSERRSSHPPHHHHIE